VERREVSGARRIAIILSEDVVSRGVESLMGPLQWRSRPPLKYAEWENSLVVKIDGDPTEFAYEDSLLELGAQWAVFPCRHEMSNPRSVFTVHTSGTWERDVAFSNARLSSWLFRRLCSRRGEYECFVEATHHGPNTVKISTTFVEIGSSEREWRDRTAVRALVETLQELGDFRPDDAPIAMTIGDLHYSTLSQEVLDKSLDIGHILPKYLEINIDKVKLAYEKHIELPHRIIIFRKNIKNPYRAEVLGFLKKLGVEVVIKG